MNSSQNVAVEDRVKRLIDERLFKAFWDAAAHFGTTDLVLIFDESQEVDPVVVYVRERLLSAPEFPESLKKKLSKLASGASFNMTTSETVFWFVPMFRDGEMACVAINAKQIAPGGTA